MRTEGKGGEEERGGRVGIGGGRAKQQDIGEEGIRARGGAARKEREREREGGSGGRGRGDRVGRRAICDGRALAMMFSLVVFKRRRWLRSRKVRQMGLYCGCGQLSI